MGYIPCPYHMVTALTLTNCQHKESYDRPVLKQSSMELQIQILSAFSPAMSRWRPLRTEQIAPSSLSTFKGTNTADICIHMMVPVT